MAASKTVFCKKYAKNVVGGHLPEQPRELLRQWGSPEISSTKKVQAPTAFGQTAGNPPTHFSTVNIQKPVPTKCGGQSTRQLQ